MIGKTVSHYRITEKLGEGGMGVVYRAEDTKLGPIALDEVLAIGVQIADGLATAHAKGIVHRDVKTANVMLAADGRPKIMDFGLARLAGTTDLTRTGTTLGTVAYMSPEQARGDDVDHRTDIWSLGVVLYEMLTGKRPFTGDRDQAVIRSILNDQPGSLAAGAAPEPTGVLAKTLAKTPSARYESASDLAGDLRAVQRNLEADPIRPAPRDPRTTRGGPERERDRLPPRSSLDARHVVGGGHSGHGRTRAGSCRSARRRS